MEEQTDIAQKPNEDLRIDVLSTLLPHVHPLQLRIPSVKNTKIEKDLAPFHKTLVDTAPISSSQSRSANNSSRSNISDPTMPTTTNRHPKPSFISKHVEPCNTAYREISLEDGFIITARVGADVGNVIKRGVVWRRK
jgi:hypothetical protein